MREVLDRPREMGRLIKKHVQQWVDVVVSFIKKGQAQGRLHAAADPEAYVMQVIALLVSSVATQHAFAALPSDRNVRELTRMAHTALFKE